MLCFGWAFLIIWRISKCAFSLSKKRQIWHHRLKNRAVSFCPMYHFAPVSPMFNTWINLWSSIKVSCHWKTHKTQCKMHFIFGTVVDSYLLSVVDFCFVNIEVQIWRYSCHVNIKINKMILIGSLRQRQMTWYLIKKKINILCCWYTFNLAYCICNSNVYTLHTCNVFSISKCSTNFFFQWNEHVKMTKFSCSLATLGWQ